MPTSKDQTVFNCSCEDHSEVSKLDLELSCTDKLERSLSPLVVGVVVQDVPVGCQVSQKLSLHMSW